MSEIINEIVPYTKIKTLRNKTNRTIFNPEIETSYKSPLVLIDYMPIFDYSKINEIEPKFIKEIYVINNIYYLGNYVSSGVLIIQSKDNKFAGVDFPKNSVFFKFEALTSQIEIDYSDDIEKVKNNLPSFSNLLFFQSDRIENNKYMTKFYTSDHLSEYQIIIKCFDMNNNILIKSINFNIF